MELKWFIEPAEIRENNERTDELKTGIAQIKKLKQLFEAGDRRLVRDILEIDGTYSFFGVVASQNWIGYEDAQDSEVPIIKVWHLLYKIRDMKSLPATIDWLRNREYLPKEGVDYSIEDKEAQCGRWSVNWYGIRPLISEN